MLEREADLSLYTRMHNLYGLEKAKQTVGNAKQPES